MGKRVTGIKGKRMLTALMSMIMALALVMVFDVTVLAADEGIGWKLDDEGTLIVTGGGSNGVLKYIDSNDAKKWEAHKDEIITIKIEGNVTTIKDNVFKGYSKVKTVELADTVTEIGVSAFAECPELTTIKFSANMQKIRQKAFQKCTALAEVTIPKTVVSISGETTGPFANCTGLTTVTFENGLTEIPDRMFKDCLSITTIKWPEGLTTIGSFAFQNARDYTVGSLPATVTAVKTDAFEGCKDTSFTVPKNMTTFQHPFGHLTEISFEEGTTKIPDNCCESVTTLKKINWPANVTEVG